MGLYASGCRQDHNKDWTSFRQQPEIDGGLGKGLPVQGNYGTSLQIRFQA